MLSSLAEKIRQVVFDGSLMLSLERCGEAVEMAQVGGREDHRSFLQRVSSTSSTWICELNWVVKVSKSK